MTEEIKNEQIKSAMKLNDINFKGYWREDEEYIDLQSFLSPKAAAIYDHELKVRREKLEEVMNGYIGGFNTSQCFSFDYEERHICLAASNSFIGMIEKQYLEALNNYPECFGTGNAVDVVIALYKNNGFEKLKWSFQRYVENALAYEICCYAVIKRNDYEFDEEVLRIDLFRQIKPSLKDWHKLEFIGGLFHVFKHFSYHGRNLSIGNEVKHTEVGSLQEIVLKCIHAFIHKEKEKDSDDYVYDQELENGKMLRFVFYREECTDTYFIKSVYMKPSKKLNQ